jgi:hypothetical protein
VVWSPKAYCYARKYDSNNLQHDPLPPRASDLYETTLISGSDLRWNGGALAQDGGQDASLQLVGQQLASGGFLFATWAPGCLIAAPRRAQCASSMLLLLLLPLVPPCTHTQASSSRVQLASRLCINPVSAAA